MHTLINVTPEAMTRLLAHGWPGNVRELWSALEQAALFSSGQSIDEPEISLALADIAPDLTMSSASALDGDEGTNLRALSMTLRVRRER